MQSAVYQVTVMLHTRLYSTPYLEILGKKPNKGAQEEWKLNSICLSSHLSPKVTLPKHLVLLLLGHVDFGQIRAQLQL